MKFTCERCGKKYATADNPTPGRVYKLKCKACGHLIVVKASSAPASEAAPARPPETASAHASGRDPAPALDPSAHSAATPIADLAPAGSVPSASPPATASISLEIGTPEPADVPDNGASRLPSFEMPTDVSTATLRGQHALEHTPTRGEPGYVDLFSDVSGIQELPQKPSEDPFMAAARASLPDGYGSGSSPVPDPFADLRDDISATSEPAPPPRQPPPVPKMPVIPKPKHQERSNLPILLIGAGVAVLVGILAFVLLSNGRTGTPAPAPVATTAPPPRAPPVAAPAPPQVEPPVAQPEPPVTAPAPPAPERSEDAARVRAEQKRKEREEAQAREEKARAEREARDREAKAHAKADREAKAQAERDAKAQAKAEREARDREAREAKARAEQEAREAKARAEQEAREARARAAAEARERERAARQAAAAADASEADGGLSQAQIEGVLRSTKPAFDSCIQAARGSDVALDGRRVMLRLNIQSTGAVSYPTLDDVTLNSTDLGTCLKGAARLMVFPAFKGDTMHVEVPLVMR